MEDEFPSDLVRIIISYISDPSLLFSLSRASKSWQERSRSPSFWHLYLTNKSQHDFNLILIEAARRGKIILFQLLWTTRFQDKLQERHVLIDSYIAAVKKNHIKTAKMIKRLGKNWNYYRWVAITRKKYRKNILLQVTVEKIIKTKNIDKLIDYLSTLDYNSDIFSEIDTIFAEYLYLNTIIHIYNKWRSVFNINEHEEILMHALEKGNLSLVKKWDKKYKPYWPAEGLWGISSKYPEVILYTLEKLRLNDFIVTDITPYLLRKFVGKDPVTIKYKPIWNQYIETYPEDAMRIIIGSYYLIKTDELIGYLTGLKNNKLIDYKYFSKDVERLLNNADESGYDEKANAIRTLFKK